MAVSAPSSRVAPPGTSPSSVAVACGWPRSHGRSRAASWLPGTITISRSAPTRAPIARSTGAAASSACHGGPSSSSTVSPRSTRRSAPSIASSSAASAAGRRSTSRPRRAPRCRSETIRVRTAGQPRTSACGTQVASALSAAAATGSLGVVSGIGVLQEGPLHAALKDFYARPGDRAEVPFGRFVIDLVRADGELVEIQTGGFSPLGPKLDALLDHHRMRIVHPVAAERRILRVDADGEVLSARRSPRRAGALEVFDRLVSFPSLLAHPNLTIEVALCREDHVRAPGPTRSRSGRARAIPASAVSPPCSARSCSPVPATSPACCPRGWARRSPRASSGPRSAAGSCSPSASPTACGPSGPARRGQARPRPASRARGPQHCPVGSRDAPTPRARRRPHRPRAAGCRHRQDPGAGRALRHRLLHAAQPAAGPAARRPAPRPPVSGPPALRGAARTELVLYRSTGVTGKAVAVSGTVSIPKGTAPRGGWPVISYAHGTTGIADQCAPSRDAAGTSVHGYNSYVYPCSPAG